MIIANRAGAAAVAVAVGIGLSACGSQTTGDATTAQETPSASETSSTSSTTPAPPTSPSPAAAPGITIQQYVDENGITSTPVAKGEPGAPTIQLPIPPGWEPAGPQTPEGAYDALVLAGPSPNKPTIVAFVDKLTGPVDTAKILEYAPNETIALPGFEGATEGKPSTLSGFDATQIGGFYTRDGVTRMLAQKTTVIPTDGAVFVLKVTAEGTDDFAMPLMDATAAIDEQTTITP